MSEYVRSDIFVGRTEEQDAVHSFIQSDNNSRLLCIYSSGEGGFGKTQLLLQVRAAYRQEEENIVVGHQLIDFYHLDMQRKIGVIEALARQLDLTESLHLIAEYRQKSISLEDDEYIEQLFKKFSAEYQEYVSRNKERTFVFLFDSYEHIQRITDKDAHSTDHSHWIETKLIPLLVNELNVRIILAGRHLPTELVSEKPIELKPFSPATSENFLKEVLREEGGIALKEMQELYRLTDGHPIRLALAADWLRHSYDPVNKLLDGIEPGKAFEGRLIKYIRQQLEENESFFISSYIAIAYQRLNADILHHLTGEKKENCEKYIKQMRTWSFIKPKGEDSVILHDVMHSLFDKYIKSEDPGFYRQNLELLIGYYKKVIFAEKQTLSETEQEKYILEMVDYGFQLDFDQGVERFCTIFDQVMEDGQYHFASNFLLKAAEDLQFRYKGQSNTLNFLKIDARKIEYDIETAEAPAKGLARANRIIDQYKDNERWKESDIEGLILLKKGTALFYLSRFREAIKIFQQARYILLCSDDGLNAHWATSWTGYTYYQLGDFQHAEEELKKSRELFYEKAESVVLEVQVWDEDRKNEYRRILQGYQISLVNLVLVYFSTGRLYEATRHARIFLHINENLQRNDREIARAKATLSLTSWVMGYRLEAKQDLDDALKLAGDDPVLAGRIKIEQLRQHFHESGFLYSHFLEYYRADDFREELGKIQDRHQEKCLSIVSDNEQIQDVVQGIEELIVKKDLGITKELLAAYLVQADLLLLRVPQVSWSTIEKVLRKGLQKNIRNKDLQLYEKIQSLGNLVRLCYFAKAWNTSDAQEVSDKLDEYKKKFLEAFERMSHIKTKKDESLYPELLARYNLLYGNILFDDAIKNTDLEQLQEAINYYLNAADLLKDFVLLKDNPFYIIRHRLITFIESIEGDKQDRIDKNKYLKIRGGYSCSPDTMNLFEVMFDSTLLCLPSTKVEDIEADAKKLHDEEQHVKFLEKFIWAESLTDALKNGIERKEVKPKQRIRLQLLLAMWLMRKSRIYRGMRTGNIDFALKSYKEAEQAIEVLTRELGEDAIEILSLKGRLYAGIGTVLYRQGSYEEFLEFYQKDELELTATLFKRDYKEHTDRARDFLFTGRNLLKQAHEKIKKGNAELRIEKLPYLNARWLGEINFRIGEFRWVNREFEKSKKDFIEAVDQYKKGKDAPIDRRLDAMESYITAVYFSKENKLKLSKVDEQCTSFIREIEKNEQECPTILAKLRLTQGDDIFNILFSLDEKQIKDQRFYQDIKYSLRGEYRNDIHAGRLHKEVQKSLRRMVICYVQACSLMKQAQSERNFAVSVRVIIRRIRMLSDDLVIEKIHSVLGEMWREYEGLHDSKVVLKTVLEFARVLEGLTKKPSNNPS
ncbi:MAG: tetratricopeptide repeat protein [Candidatus Electrothrix sp. Rat3]|nr:tetratricopeptide repeat protein [Candidatus Electrothrix rattekaaiensis]